MKIKWFLVVDLTITVPQKADSMIYTHLSSSQWQLKMFPHCQILEWGENCPQLRSSGVERRVELGCGLTTVFVDSTGISGAKMALLSWDILKCQGLYLSSGEVTGHGPLKGSRVLGEVALWGWSNKSFIEGGSGPSQCSWHMLHSRIVHLLLSIFHSMIKPLRIGVCLTWFCVIKT